MISTHGEPGKNSVLPLQESFQTNLEIKVEVLQQQNGKDRLIFLHN
jgi:hypothetical protein